MAEKTEKVEVPVEPANTSTRAPSGKTIEAYRDELGTDSATFAGVKARERWPAQFRLTKRQYETAVDRFLTGPTVARGDN